MHHVLYPHLGLVRVAVGCDWRGSCSCSCSCASLQGPGHHEIKSTFRVSSKPSFRKAPRETSYGKAGKCACGEGWGGGGGGGIVPDVVPCRASWCGCCLLTLASHSHIVGVRERMGVACACAVGKHGPGPAAHVSLRHTMSNLLEERLPIRHTREAYDSSEDDEEDEEVTDVVDSPAALEALSQQLSRAPSARAPRSQRRGGARAFAAAAAARASGTTSQEGRGMPRPKSAAARITATFSIVKVGMWRGWRGWMVGTLGC